MYQSPLATVTGFSPMSLAVLVIGRLLDGAGEVGCRRRTLPLTVRPSAPGHDSTSRKETLFRMSSCTPEREKNSGPPS